MRPARQREEHADSGTITSSGPLEVPQRSLPRFVQRCRLLCAYLPRLVFTRDNLLPSWQPEPTDVCRSCFDTLAMKPQVGTKNLNFSGACMSPMRNADPSIATQLNWIHRIRNHRSSQAKVVLRDRIGDTIPLVAYRLPHALWNRRWLAQSCQFANKWHRFVSPILLQSLFFR